MTHDPTFSRGPTKAETRMNKQTKGAIAAGAAALLLAGGAGTMAAWNATTNVGGGTVNAGKLTLTSGGAGTWTYADSTPFNPLTDTIVPGDTVTYHGTVTVGAKGKNLSATFTTAPGSIVAKTPGNAADEALAAEASTGTVTAKIGTNAVTTITEANDTNVVTVDVPVTFPKTPATNASQLGAVSLSNFAVTLTQS